MHIQENDLRCSGCKACISICPVGAIQEGKDTLGFFYPKIDADKCINCGLCTKVCQIDNVGFHDKKEQKFFAGQNKDEEILKASSSGGVFRALAEKIIEEQGSVYGVRFDENWKVVHDRAVKMEALEDFYGSKYVQSDCTNVYEKIVEDLRNNRKVLFSGTPCQCQGVLKYVKQQGLEDDKLILVDFVCHGVSSPQIWKQYVEKLAEERGEIATYTFRNKDKGWKKFRTQITNVSGEEISDNKYSFFELYSSLLITRSSCFQCYFTSFERCSDITLGDFWNIDCVENSFEQDKGVSQILINTVKGQQLFEKISDRVQVMPCKEKDCWQPHLEYPAEKPRGRAQFEKYYSENDFTNVLYKYGRGTLVGKCKKIFVPIVKCLGLYVVAGKLYNIVMNRNRKN